MKSYTAIGWLLGIALGLALTAVIIAGFGWVLMYLYNIIAPFFGFPVPMDYGVAVAIVTLFFLIRWIVK